MRCSSCDHDNPAAARFCNGCGAVLTPRCPACQADNPVGARFCNACGASLIVEAARAGDRVDARKIVSILFADLGGSTALHERLDPESVRRVMERYYATVRAAVEAQGGTIVKLLGDGVMAAFGVPRVAEDDALRAVRAAVAIAEAVRHSGASNDLWVRVAVNTGEVVVSAGDSDVVGDPVNVAARLQEQGREGDVVIGEATQRLVATLVTLAPLGSFALKGRAEAVRAYRVVSLERPASATMAAFVGRDAEMARLEAVFDAAVATPATRLAVLLGSPGLGKSRLIDELGRRHANGATILAAHCDAAGGATFAPLAQVLRGFLGLDDGSSGDVVRAAVVAALAAGDEGERGRIAGGIAGLLGDAATSPEETFFVVRRFFAGLAAARPVVLVIDDLHWAEPLLLDLVEHLVQWGTGVPLFVLVGARPELHDVRSSLVAPSGLVADVVTLGGLDAGAAMRLAANVIGAADLPAVVAAKVLATSEGNPLFVGELVRMLVQEGALTKDGERWIVGANLAALEMPPTIHALLAARIERLQPEERTVLERAAVVGRHFSRSAVAALLSRNGTELDARLESLRRSELIERDTGWLLGEPVMRFHHVLIRDAAYRRLLKGTRAELHGRLADWIEARVGDAPEHDEMIGWHLEQAHQHLRELGALDAAGTALGERAARRLAAAGRRALARDDVSLAAGLCGRALDRLTREAPERADLVLDWCEALLAAGDVGPAADAIVELERVATESPRLRAWHTCFAGQLTVLTAPEALRATSERVGAAARELAALGDAAGEAKAHFVHAQALGRLGKVGACEAALDQALAAARRAGDRRRANAVLAGAPLAALWGPSPVTRASGRCLDVVRVLRITQGAPAVEAVALSCQGVLEALRGRTEAARRMLASSRTMVEELGISHRLYETDVFAGRIDLLEGDAPAAERALRAGYEGLRDLGLGIDAARAAALLGRALLVQDRAAEAETLSHESELLAGDDLQAAIAWRGVRAEALARRGDHAAAITFAEAAVAIAAATDALLDHADARLALAAALRAGGRRAEADAEERRAFELWEAKGATVLAEGTRRVADHDGLAAPAPETRPEPRAPRRVRPNAATALSARMEAAVRARDLGAIDALYGDNLTAIDHPNATTCTREGELESSKRTMRLPRFDFRLEPLATLGESLGLTRRVVSGSGRPGAVFDVAEYEMEHIALTEVDQRGRLGYSEVFSPHHLGDAIARLYERYAEKLPEGPARERATVSARAVAFMLTPADAPDLTELYAPTYEDVDHRSVGYGAVSVDEARSKLRESFRDLVEGLRYRVDDVLALDTNGFVRKTTASGVWREGGGSFERTVCTFSIFGPDGRVTRHETFDPDREAEALARFDALTAAPAPKTPTRRRVRPNAASRTSAAIEAAFARRDLDAVDALLGDPLETVEHPTATRYGREGQLESSRRMMRMPDLDVRIEPLATLGDSLCLARRIVSASGTAGGRFDVGEYEIESIVLNEVDAAGRLASSEVFASDHLCQAIARLYARYAESLPEGPERMRATGSARAHSVWDGPVDTERVVSVIAPSYVCVDHRSLGTWSSQGHEQSLQHWRGQADLAAGFSRRDDDILAFAPEASVIRNTYFGTSRVSGGYFENVMLQVNVFGADGLYTRCELFEPGQEAEALARFDALTASAAPTLRNRRLRPNAATVFVTRFDAAFAARDLEGLAALHADDYEETDHMTEVTYGREGVLASLRRVLRSGDPRSRSEVLATLGDGLAIARRWISTSHTRGGHFDVAESEREWVAVAETDERGLMRRHEAFAPDRLGEAVIRLYERHAERLPEGRARARAAATARALATFTRHATDPDRFAAALAPAIESVDLRTVGFGTLRGRDAVVGWMRALLDPSEDVSWRLDDVLALSEHASLVRATQRGRSRASGGEWERPICTLRVHDTEGLVARLETFEPEQESEALARYDALVGDAGDGTAPAPVDGAFANAATRVLERFVRASAEHDWQSLANCFAESLRFDDRRPLLRMQLPKGSFLEQHRVLFDVPNGRWITTSIATRGERLVLARLLFQGEVEGGGGALEIDHLSVLEVGDDGRMNGIVLYEPAALDAACAELDARFEAGEGARSAEPFANAASATVAPVMAAMIAHDWQRFAQLFAGDFRMSDRRRVVQLELDRDQYIAFTREVADGRTIRAASELLATRGERLALTRSTYEFAGADVGPSEIAFLILTEVDERGRIAAYVRWDLDDLDAAYAELDARYQVGDGALHGFFGSYLRALARRDWDTIATLYPPDFVEHDNRVLALLGTTRGPEAWMQDRALIELAPDTVVRVDHLRHAPRGLLSHATWQGSRDGARYEIPFIVVHELNDQGRLKRNDLYDPEQIDRAFARFAELTGPVSSPAPFANAATRAFDRGTMALGARDWAGFAALFPHNCRIYDRTSIGQFEADGPQWLAGFREMVEMTSGPPTRQVLATRGERFALARALWRGAGGDIGPSEVEWLLIIEVDDRGDHRVVVSCKPDDLDAAYAELDARWWAGEERAHPRVAAYQTAFERRLASRDWDALATLFAPTLVARDHRLVGWDTLRGPAAFVGAFRALVDLAPDVWVRVDHMRMSERGIIGDVAWVGTRDGGAFESPFINVVELDADGKAARLDLYDPHHLDAALARFDEIRTSAVRDPLAAIARPNAAAATMERWQATFDAALESDDWEVVRGLCAAGMIFEDRQRMALVSGNAELMIASARERARTGARPEARLVGTAGDRVVIVRMLWSGGPPGGRFEIEYFSVIEVDEAGRLTAVIFFDFDDPPAAVREAWARWATIDPAAAPWVDLVGAIRDSYNANDWERLRALFADDVVIEDHRRTGFGRMEGVDVYLESVKVLWGLVSDQRVEMGWFWPAVERHGVVIAAGRFGTLKDGGAFESEFLSLWVVAGGRITWFEMFEVEDLDKALARLAELRPDPLRIPPNAATRAYDRWYERAKAGDWEAIQALFDERFRFEDRRRVMRLIGDRDMGIASDRYTWESGGRPTRTLLSTVGDRMVLQRMLWTLSEGGRVSEVELIELNEVDADGRFITALLFDPDDRAAASAELFERYAASGAEGLPPETIELARAFNAHDLERMRTLLPAEFYLDDRRRTGVGRMEGADAYLRSLAALWELSNDLRSEALYTVTSAEHGRLMVARWFGTNTEGGEFEAVFVTIGLLRGGRPVGVEIFELDDLEAARARFEELGSRQR